MIYVLIIITIILIMPIEIVFTKDENYNDIDIYLTKLFNLRLDFDEILKLLLTTKENRDQITIKGLKHNYELFNLSRNLIYDASKHSRPKKLTLILKVRKIQPEVDIFLYVIYWNFLLFLRNKFHKAAPRMEDEEFGVEYKDDYNINFKWSLRLRIIYIVFSFIKNYKDLFKIRKFLRKGKNKNGKTSNI